MVPVLVAAGDVPLDTLAEMADRVADYSRAHSLNAVTTPPPATAADPALESIENRLDALVRCLDDFVLRIVDRHPGSREEAQWEKTLHDASLQLMQIIIQHSERKSSNIKEKEYSLRRQSDLNHEDNNDLEEYENQITAAAKERKRRKLYRDGVTETITTHAPTPATPTDINRDVKAAPPIVNNLSSAQLSATKIRLLSKGLAFCPASRTFNEFQLYQGLDNFARNMHLREYFHDHEPSRTVVPGSPGKTCSPPEQPDTYQDMYISALQKDIISACSKTKRYKNSLSSKERKSQELLNRGADLVINPADKGGLIVISDKSEYLREGYRPLGNKNFYTQLEEDHTKLIESKIIYELHMLRKNGKTTVDMFKALQPIRPAPGRFYFLPKIHKKNNPSPPIVPSNSTVTERMSSALDFIIKEIVPTITSYNKDIKHFLREITGLEVPNNCILVTMNVVSFYMNITKSDGIDAAVTAFKKASMPVALDEDTLSNLLR
ncbi:hypothetical protein HPB51_023439 [Rhipicephalus microplus]|uniref:Uncharacterized protein n=1 Tax=Rhipicephalus microplus TaxID=6941 RepID=A0A9J6D7F4_RHIMP|nr:hypothetical protein HPB51_023439 [Rhipicephalus microplus]